MKSRKIRNTGNQFTQVIGTRKDPLAGVDLKKEHDLIMQKKSKLCARDRRRVIAQIEYDKKQEKK